MARKNENTEHIEGRLYSHSLEVKTVKNQQSANFGKDYIGGEIDIATDEAGLNVITVRFSYVTPQTAQGKDNSTYKALKKIIDGAPTWLDKGKDEATKISVNTSLGLNEWYDRENKLVSNKVHEGGFVTILENEVLKPEELRNTFKVDMLIHTVQEVEPANETETSFARVKGGIFNFKNEYLPVEFKVVNPAGIDHFLGLDASKANPVYIKLWGRIVCETIVTETVIQSAFGDPAVTRTTKKTKEWVITGVATEPFEFGEEGVLTEKELAEILSNREIHVANIKKQQDEYKASKTATSAPQAAPAAPTINRSGFSF
jgi:hypothetical protein